MSQLEFFDLLRLLKKYASFTIDSSSQSYTEAKTQAAITKLGFETMDHPPDCPDLAPCDFAIFPSFKKILSLCPSR